MHITIHNTRHNTIHNTMHNTIHNTMHNTPKNTPKNAKKIFHAQTQAKFFKKIKIAISNGLLSYFEPLERKKYNLTPRVHLELLFLKKRPSV